MYIYIYVYIYMYICIYVYIHIYPIHKFVQLTLGYDQKSPNAGTIHDKICRNSATKVPGRAASAGGAGRPQKRHCVKSLDPRN